MPTVDIPGVGIVNFPGGMPPEQLRSAVMRMHAAPSMAAEKANVSDTQDEGFGNAMMMGDDQIEGMKKWAPIVGGMVAGPAAEAAGSLGGAAIKVAGSPAGAAAIGGGLNYLRTGSLVSAGEAALRDGLLARFLPGAASAMLPRSLLARMTHGLAQAAVEEMPAAAAVVAPTVEAAAPAAYRGIPAMMKVAAPIAEDAAAATNAARAAGGASRVAAMAKAAPMAQTAAPVASVAAPVAESAAPAAESAAETLLQTRLRASVLLKDNPAALAEEIASKVVSLKQGAGKGLSAAQIGTSLQDIYGLPPAAAKNMVTMIFQTHGFK